MDMEWRFGLLGTLGYGAVMILLISRQNEIWLVAMQRNNFLATEVRFWFIPTHK